MRNDVSMQGTRWVHLRSLALAAGLATWLGCGGDVPNQSQDLAGTAPARLDDNRSAGYSPALTALVNIAAPFVCPLYPVCTGVDIGGRVVANPRIVNLYWDDDWDSHNPSSPTVATIDDFTSRLVAGPYLDFANQYGVSRGSLHSSHGSSSLCGTRRPGGPTDIASLIAWVTCEVQAPFTGVPFPDHDTLYAVFVPEGAPITGTINADCDPNVAVHVWSAAAVPDPQLLNPSAFRIEGFPIAVVPAACSVVPQNSAATFDNFTANLSHELAEATLDPFAPTGWIDNSLSADLTEWTSKGEPADICSDIGAVRTAPVRLPDGLLVETYWSNADNACVPFGDRTPPVLTPSISGTLGNGGWYVGDVTVTWSVSDPDSAISSQAGCGPATISADTAGTTLTCTATSLGGTSSSSVTVKRDATPPTVAAAATSAPNAAGWYRGDVSVHFTCADGLSGIPAGACPPDQVLGGEGAAVSSVAQVVTDEAGNTSAPSNVVTVKIDRTPPSVTYAGNAGTYTVDEQVAITCSATDALSGVASSTCADVTGPAWSFGLGPHVVSASATDAADNSSTASSTFTVQVTFDSLCSLTGSFSRKPHLADRLCRQLHRAAEGECCEEVAEALEEYREEVREHVPRAFTRAQAHTLVSLARALAPASCQEERHHGDDRDHHRGGGRCGHHGHGDDGNGERRGRDMASQ